MWRTTFRWGMKIIKVWWECIDSGTSCILPPALRLHLHRPHVTVQIWRHHRKHIWNNTYRWDIKSVIRVYWPWRKLHSPCCTQSFKQSKDLDRCDYKVTVKPDVKNHMWVKYENEGTMQVYRFGASCILTLALSSNNRFHATDAMRRQDKKQIWRTTSRWSMRI